MMQKFSYHTHTNFSDGRNSLEEMLTRAIELGWEEFGISDHMIIHKNIYESPSWQRWKESAHIYYNSFEKVYDSFAKHIEHVREVSQNYPIKVRVGAEVDYFTYDGWEENFSRMLEKLNLDYCISGNHFFFMDENCENIVDIKDGNLMSEEEQAKMVKRHFRTILRAAQSNHFVFIAHLDYVRKLPLCGKNDFLQEKEDLINGLSAAGATTELSTKGLRKADDFYPNNNMLKMIMDKNIKLVISDDAHRISELGYEFNTAESVLEEVKYNNRWCFVDK